MQYSFREIHTLNQLSDNPEYSKRFNTPIDLKVMTLIVLVTISAVVASAILFKVDKIVPAQGVLDTQAKLFEVRAAYQGFVQTIHVDEGMEVDLNEVLITFDTELRDREIERLNQEIATLSRSVWTDFYQINTWLEEPTRTALTNQLETVHNPIEGLGYQAFLVRALELSLTALDQSILGLETQQATLERQLYWLDQNIAMEEDELGGLGRLKEQGIESLSSVTDQERILLDLRSNRESLRSELENAGVEQDRMVVERSKLKDDFILERLLRLQEQLDQYHQAQSRLASQIREREDMTARAPFAAIVDQVLVRGKHEVMEAGSALVRLRPRFDQQDLEIDILTPSNYAIWVEPGMEFRASSLGNNPEDHGRLHGIIDFISESSEVAEGTGNNGQRFYRMTGTITRMDISNPETFLRPGLQLSVEIKAGQRRLINYLFDPFTKHLRTALTEPS